MRARERGGGGIGVVGRGERVMLASPVDGLGPCVCVVGRGDVRRVLRRVG